MGDRAMNEPDLLFAVEAAESYITYLGCGCPKDTLGETGAHVLAGLRMVLAAAKANDARGHDTLKGESR